MTLRDDARDNPDGVHIFALLRAMERGDPDKPRIGKSQILAQDVVRLEQDPFLTPATSTLQSAEFPPGEAPRVRTPFLGYFGPQGALPLIMTAEAMRWSDRRDDSFVRFANVFATRFLQLFYRAWADARPIAQADRPDDDRFAAWAGATIGIGTPANADRDTVPDNLKLGYIGILGNRVRSAARLEQVVQGMLNVDATVRERAGLWLEFEPGDLTRLGATGATLGRNSHAGARVYSINDKAVLEIRTEDLDAYRSFLPGGDGHTQLRDLVRFMFGDQVDFDVELALPDHLRPAACLGQSGQLGWTAWAAPPRPDPTDDVTYISDANFQLTGASSVT